MLTFLVRMQNGLIMAAISTRYMFAHPKLLFFPLLRIVLFSALITFSILSVPVTLHLTMSPNLFSEKLLTTIGVVLLVMIIALTAYLFSFIMLFSSVTTIDYLWDLFQGKTPSIRTSLKVACKRIPTILLWAAVHTVIRLSIKLLEGDKDSSVIRKIGASIANVTWSTATYFVAPLIAEKRRAVFEMLKDSSLIMKQQFGETVGVMVSFNAVANLIFPGIILGIVVIMNYLYDSGADKQLNIDFYKYHHATPILIGVAILTLIIRVFITSAQDVFRAAAFSYTQGKSTGPFTLELINKSFTK